MNSTTEPSPTVFKAELIDTVALVLLYTLEFVVGFLANLLYIALLYRYKKLRTRPNLILLNLITADLARTIVNCPYHIFGALSSLGERTPAKDGLCKTVLFLSYQMGFTCILSMSMISTDRFLAIAFPYFYRDFVGKKTFVAMSLFVWIQAIITVLPAPIVDDWMQYRGQKPFLCAFGWESVKINYILSVITINFLLPFIQILSANIVVFTIARRQLKQIKMTTQKYQQRGYQVRNLSIVPDRKETSKGGRASSISLSLSDQGGEFDDEPSETKSSCSKRGEKKATKISRWKKKGKGTKIEGHSKGKGALESNNNVAPSIAESKASFAESEGQYQKTHITSLRNNGESKNDPNNNKEPQSSRKEQNVDPKGNIPGEVDVTEDLHSDSTDNGDITLNITDYQISATHRTKGAKTRQNDTHDMGPDLDFPPVDLPQGDIDYNEGVNTTAGNECVSSDEEDCSGDVASSQKSTEKAIISHSVSKEGIKEAPSFCSGQTDSLRSDLSRVEEEKPQSEAKRYGNRLTPSSALNKDHNLKNNGKDLDTSGTPRNTPHRRKSSNILKKLKMAQKQKTRSTTELQIAYSTILLIIYFVLSWTPFAIPRLYLRFNVGNISDRLIIYGSLFPLSTIMWDPLVIFICRKEIRRCLRRFLSEKVKWISDSTSGNDSNLF